MTVASDHSRIDYVGNGTTTVFPYDFRILGQEDLQVSVDGVTQTLTTDYTVSGADEPNGGDVTFVVAPGPGAEIALVRSLGVTQETRYPIGSKFPAQAHEAVVDKLTMLIQQVLEKVGRSLTFVPTSTFKDLSLPEPVGQAFLRWKSDLSGMENVSGSSSITGDVAVITGEGDLVQGGTSGVPEALPVGGSNTVLTVSAGKAAWRSITAWLSALGLLSVKGDLVTTTGAVAQKLGVGTNGQALLADSAQPTGLKWGDIAATRFTGEQVDYWGVSAPAGWVLASGRTIGDASSGATERANADTANLFALLWDSVANTELPIQDSAGVASTRGADAATDFAAHKRLPLPDARGRGTVGKDDMGGTAAGRMTAAGGIVGATLGAAGGAETIALSVSEMPAHTHGVTDLGHSHSVSDPGHNHQVTAGNATGGSSQDFMFGSQVHSGFFGTVGAGTGISIVSNGTGISIQSAGSGTAHKNVQPGLVVNKIIKL